MELENKTPFHASLFRGVIGRDRFCASVVVRVTYDIKDGQLFVADEQCWKVSAAPYECEYGQMRSDELFYRGGVDLFVLGSAYLPPNSKENSVEVKITIADKLNYSLLVFGDRVWQDVNGNLAISKPKKFRSIPLTLDYAFGGKDEWDKLPVLFPSNPYGKGYYITEDSALDKPLPNIESVNNRITIWKDIPDPVGMGLCPMAFEPSLKESTDFNTETGEIIKILPSLYNASFPAMVVDNISAGDVVSLEGVTESGSILEFEIPKNSFIIKLCFGEEITEKKMCIDQVGIETEKDRIFISYRYPFRYMFVPLQKRFCRLVFAEEV